MPKGTKPSKIKPVQGAKIKVDFLITVSEDDNGKVVSEIKFALPDHPDLTICDSMKRSAIHIVGDLCHGLLTHPDGLPE